MDGVRKTPWTAFRESRGGSITVELALLAPVMAFMLVGAIDFGSYVFSKMQLQNASRAGAQYAIQAGRNIEDTAAITAAVQAASDLEAGTTISDSTVRNSIIGRDSRLTGVRLDGAMLGNRVEVAGIRGAASLGDDCSVRGD